MGRKHIINNAYIHDCLLLIEDEIADIRRNAYQSMLNLVEFLEGQDHFLLSEALGNLVDKLVDEKEDDIIIMVLKLIQFALQAEGATEQILDTQVIKRLSSLLEHQDAKVHSGEGGNGLASKMPNFTQAKTYSRLFSSQSV